MSVRLRVGIWSVIWLILVGSASVATHTLSARSLNAPARASGTIPPPQSVVFLPLLFTSEAPRVVDVIPIDGNPVDRPAVINPDLNLAVRGYVTTTAHLGLVDYGGATDVNAPQLANLFSPPRLPTFTVVFQVYDWDWGCGSDGCRGAPIASPPVTLLAMQTAPGEPIHLPYRRPDIFNGVYVAMVLYADENRITLAYTRHDTPARGYLIHLEELAVDAAIVARYRAMNEAGRAFLPALRNDELVGHARGDTVKVAVRDTGSFMDPRSRKDWWQGVGGITHTIDQ